MYNYRIVRSKIYRQEMVSNSIIAIVSLFSLMSHQVTIGQWTLQNRFDLSCLCKFDESGYCKLIIPAKRNKACKCNDQDCWYDESLVYARCKGEEVECANPESPQCKNPDVSYLSCLQGKGDCRGTKMYDNSYYQQDGCKCSYFDDAGCQVSQRAPNHYTCRCHYVWYSARGFICIGRVELCDKSMWNHPECKNSLEYSCKWRVGNGRDSPASIYYN